MACGASMLAMYWNIRAASKRFGASLALSCITLLVGYLGLSRVQFHASSTVNGQLQWSVNSQWFFIGALVLGTASLGLTVWTWWRSQRGDRSKLPGGSAPVCAPE
jgi:protein-S-isoprenylcysteine O-methyltransferase Ste14